ncbi:MAG: FGGY-family carbohydrate kinase [Desulfosarcinaceae bacterium]|nr:FGGY-family carbohydrate kinase [Desulfosarcinaceae bacterium]
MTPQKRRSDLILVFDAGTQSVRAALIDPHGQIQALVKTPIDPYQSPQPGWAELDPDAYWHQLCRTARALLDLPHVDAARIRGVTLTTQRATLVNLDARGCPLRPAITWLDQRRISEDLPLPWLLRTALAVSGKRDTAMGAMRDCKSNWIREKEPDVWSRTAKLLFLSGFLTHRLTGNFVDSAANMVGYVPFDFRRHRWAGRLDLKWKLFPMEDGILPDLVAPGAELGTISPQAAAESGLPDGLPVIAAATDKACEVLGAGCTSPETACLSYGTTATVNTATDRYVELKPLLPPYPGAIPGTYTNEVMVYRGFWMVSWFRKEFGLREEQLAVERQVTPETLFDELVAKVPPGCQGLILQPYWSPGFDTDADAKGAVIGFGAVHTRAHLYRAILEGLAFALKEGLQTLERRNAVPVTGLRVSGGGSQSAAALQITSDIFDRPVQRPHTYETAALGAAVCAAVGLGFHHDYAAATAAMTRIGRTFTPNPRHRDLYHALFERVYLKIYPRLAPIFGEIQRITGYPEQI